MAKAELVSSQALAQLEEKMNATSQVIPPDPLFFHHLEMALSHTLNGNSQSYEAKVPLSRNYIEELMWWDSHVVKWNGKSLLSKEVDMTIDSDTSLIRKGCKCVRTNGPEVHGPWKNARCI